MSIVPIDLQTQGNYEQLFRGNYNKGLRVFKSCMIQDDLREQLITDAGALNCVFTNINYAAASGKLALAMNEFDEIVPAFNNYCASKGIAVKSTLALTWADATCKAAMMADSDIMAAITACSKLKAVCYIPTFLDTLFNVRGYENIALGTELNLSLAAFTLAATSFPAQTITFQVAGIDQDVDADGNTLPITMVMKELHNGTFKMYDSNVNTVLSSYAYTHRANIYGALPSNIAPYVATTRKKVCQDGNTATLVNYDAQCFLLREREIFGSRTYSRTEEYDAAFQYQGFASGVCTKVKKLNNGAGSAAGWWEISPYSGDAGYFCCVNNNGNAYGGSASTAYGLCFGFAFTRAAAVDPYEA